MRRQLPLSSAHFGRSAYALMMTSLILSSSRQMRFSNKQGGSNNGSNTNANESKIKLAPISDVSKPVKLSDDFTPLPLPRYDDVGGLEPSPVKSSSTYDGERMLSKKRQVLLDEMFPDDNIDGQQQLDVDAIALATEEQQRKVLLESQKTSDDLSSLADDELKYFQDQAASLRYAREPSENPGIHDRHVCLRSVRDLCIQLKEPRPNIERSVAALNDITDKFSDFLAYAQRDLTAFGLEQEYKSHLDRTPEDDVASREILERIYEHRRQSHDTVLEDFLLVGKTLREMYVGAGNALNFRSYRMAHHELPTWMNDQVARTSFFSFFKQTEELMNSYVVPVLSVLKDQEARASMPPQKVALLLESVTEFLRLLAHFQLLDFERHFNNFADLPSSQLSPQIGASQRAFWSWRSGNTFLDELSVLMSPKQRYCERQQRYVAVDEAGEDGGNIILDHHINDSLKFVPTKTLAEWYLNFTASYQRVDKWLARHVEFSQLVSTELVQNRLLPACKEAFTMSKGKDASALFLDSNLEKENQQPVLGFSSGSERSDFIANLLFSCAIGDVTLPRDFLEEALLDGALAASSKNPSTLVISSPNFFIGLVKLFGGAGRGNMPIEKIFELLHLELSKFRKNFDEALKESAAKNNNNNSDLIIMNFQHQEHDWISAVYEVAFATEERAASIRFLERLNFSKETLLRHVYRFADPDGKIDADFNKDEAGLFDHQYGDVIERERSVLNKNSVSNGVATTQNGRQRGSSMASTFADDLEKGNDQLFRPTDPVSQLESMMSSSNNNNNKSNSELDFDFPSFQEVKDKAQSILQQSLFPGSKNSSNAELAAYLLTEDLSVANSKIPQARSAFILHHSFLQDSNIDSLKQIIELCNDANSVLIVPSYVLFQIAAFTADTMSRSGRLSNESLKKQALRAILVELVEGRAYYASAEEEVVMRFHEGHADADTLVWETCSFLQSRAPLTGFYVLAEINHRAAHRDKLFTRPALSTVRHSSQRSSEDSVMSHPLLKSLEPGLLMNNDSSNSSNTDNNNNALVGVSKNMLRPITGSGYDQLDGLKGDEAAGKLWNSSYRPVGVFREPTRSRIADPVGKKFLVGQFHASNRSDLYSWGSVQNYVGGVDSKAGRSTKRNKVKGLVRGRAYEDMTGLGMYTPDHGTA